MYTTTGNKLRPPAFGDDDGSENMDDNVNRVEKKREWKNVPFPLVVCINASCVCVPSLSLSLFLSASSCLDVNRMINNTDSIRSKSSVASIVIE